LGRMTTLTMTIPKARIKLKTISLGDSSVLSTFEHGIVGKPSVVFDYTYMGGHRYGRINPRLPSSKFK